MPNNGPIEDTPCQIITNGTQIEQPSHEFILCGQFYRDGANSNGGVQIAFTVPPKNLAVIVSHSMKEAFLSGLSQAPVSYLSRGEVQGDIATTETLSDEYRILRIMPVLTIQQGSKEFLHLTLRGQGASDTGHWGCASSLVSGPVSDLTIYETLNRETGLLVDGKIAALSPSEDVSGNASKIISDAHQIKRFLASKSFELKNAFGNNASFIDIGVQADLPKTADTVTFYGALGGEMDCVVHDNAAQRTLTLMFPVVARMPENAVLTAFNGEGYNGPAALVDKEFLKKEGPNSGIKLIPGLQELVFAK